MIAFIACVTVVDSKTRLWREALKFGILWKDEGESVSAKKGPDGTDTKICCAKGFLSLRQCLSATFEISQPQNGGVVRASRISLQDL
jgi:hypothetical protein